MTQRKEICEYLKKNHTGKDRAVYSRELERLFHLTDRSVRRRISSLRQEGYPICSDGTGYYYAENQHEINATVSRLNELVTGLSNARTGLLFSSVTEPSAEIEIKIKVNGGVPANA